MRNRNNYKKFFWVLNIGILLSLSISCCKNQSRKCSLKQNLGNALIYEKDSLICEVCVYKLKVNLPLSEFGDCINRLDNSFFFIVGDSATFWTPESVVNLPLCKTKNIYEFKSKITRNELYTISLDSKLNGISSGGIELNLVTDKEAQIVGYFMKDSSSYIIEKYHKVIFRSIYNELSITPKDTSKYAVISEVFRGVIK